MYTSVCLSPPDVDVIRQRSSDASKPVEAGGQTTPSRPHCPAGFVGQWRVTKNTTPVCADQSSLDGFLLIYILDGRCRYSDSQDRNGVFGAGDLFFCFPGTSFACIPGPGESWSDFRLSFGGPAFDLWCDLKILDRDHFVHHLEPVEYWLGRFEAMLRRLRPESTDPMIAIAGLQQLLAEAFAFEKAPSANIEEQAWLVQAEALLGAQDRVDELDLQDIASSLNMSYASFRRKFVQLSGVPAGKYHITTLMHKACRLMFESSLTNKEIADRYGFCNEYHFSSRFKQIIGVSPREFRRRLRCTTPA